MRSLCSGFLGEASEGVILDEAELCVSFELGLERPTQVVHQGGDRTPHLDTTLDLI
jgi:hypothetical protein